MNAVSPTVVAVWDASPEADAALEWASVLARSTALPLVISRVVEPDDLEHDASIEAMDELERRAEEVSAALPGLRVATEIVGGEPAVVLRRLTDRGGATLVFGTSDHEERESGSASSLGPQIAATARSTVVVVPAEAGSDTDVVVGIDGSEVALVAAEAAAEQAARTGAQLHLVHVWEDPRTSDGGVLAANYRRWSGARHAAVLETARARLEGRHPDVRVLSHLVRGSAGAVLRRFGETAASLFVGAPRFGDWPEQVLGPVASELIVAPGCAVVLVAEGSSAPATARTTEKPATASTRVAVHS